MYKWLCIVLLLSLGCVHEQPIETSYHPQVISHVSAFTQKKDGSQEFLGEAIVNEKPYRLVLVVTRGFPRRSFEHDNVQDQAKLLWNPPSIKVELLLDQTGKYQLKEYPVHLSLFHRKRNGSKKELVEWWITASGCYAKKPEELMRFGRNHVQSEERFINPQ